MKQRGNNRTDRSNRGAPSSGGRSGGSRRPISAKAHSKPPIRSENSGPSGRWVVGIHSVAETLRIRPDKIREIWLREDWSTSQSLRDLESQARAGAVPIKTKSQNQLDALASGHQGVAITVAESPKVDWQKLESEPLSLVVVLDGIEDPHNLGAILRSAWLLGVDAIFIPADRAAGLTPTVCKIASGGAEHVPVEVHANIGALQTRLREIGFWIFGLSEQGTRFPWEFQLPEKMAWIVGSEAGGMRVATARACDELARLPQVAGGSSFNASTALAMALVDTCRQRIQQFPSEAAKFPRK